MNRTPHSSRDLWFSRHKVYREWVVRPMEPGGAGSYHRHMMNRLGRLHVGTATLLRGVVDGERGASMVEYGLLIALIALVAFASVVLFGNAVADQWGSSADSIVNA